MKAKITQPRILRNVIDRMKNIDKFLHIAAGKDSTLIFKLVNHTPLLSASVRYYPAHGKPYLGLSI